MKRHRSPKGHTKDRHEQRSRPTSTSSKKASNSDAWKRLEDWFWGKRVATLRQCGLTDREITNYMNGRTVIGEEDGHIAD